MLIVNERNAIQKMKPIKWAKPSSKMKIFLCHGENPFRFAPLVCVIKREAKMINKYPDHVQKELKRKLAKYTGLKSDNVILGNGSDGLIALIAKVFLNEGDESLTISPSFPGYKVATQIMGGVIKYVPLNKEFKISAKEILNVITNKTKIIWIANPNNPTGNILLDSNEIEKILKNYHKIFVVDECYFEFSGISSVQLIKKYKNLIITRSFSKSYAMAGSRFGYALACEEIIKSMYKVDDSSEPFAVNRFAQAGALAVLNNPKKARLFVNTFLKFKKDFEKKLQQIEGIECIETKTSFSLIKTKLRSKNLVQALKNYGIAIKSCEIYENMDPNISCLAIPTKKEQKKVLQALKMITKTC